jgi:hypothetical protein
MADRRGTSGRGGTATDPPGVNLDDFVVVEQTEQEITRSRLAPSALQPLVDLAMRNLGRKIEQTDVREDGEGNKVRTPHVYTFDEATEYANQLTQLRSRNRLSQKGLSLRILSDPPLSKGKPADDKVRVQFYIINRKTGDGSASA